jgi:hypothetical protein
VKRDENVYTIARISLFIYKECIMIFLWVISHGQFSIFIDISVYFRSNGEDHENGNLCDEKFYFQ